MKKLMISLLMLVSFISCNSTTTVTTDDYTPTPYYTCNYQYVYSFETNQYSYQYVCYWVYYSNEGTLSQELDLAADISDSENAMLQINAEYYANTFGLSFENATKIAKQVLDLNALKDRSIEDLSDFAEKLYGVNSSKIIEAVSMSQVGNSKELDSLIKKSAEKFDITEVSMRALIRELHGKALSENGIEL